MCGRFTLTADPEQLQAAFASLGISVGGDAAIQNITPRYNITPSQPVLALANDGQSRFDFYTWGLVPSWAKDPAIGNRMINARAETLAEKPAFRSAYRRRRCLIPASGFYEWKQEVGRKTKSPMYIHLKSGEPFAFAGLWESWNSPDGSNILSCTIITTTPNELMQSIHNRMPVILPQSSYELWLATGDIPAAKLQPLLQPYPASEMSAYPVSTLVNSPANDLPDCIAPIAL